MRILFYCDTVFSFGGVQRVLAEIAKALSGKHEVTILTTDTCTDLSMYGYAESTVRFDSFSYSASSFIERLLCKGYSFLYKHGLPHTRLTSEWYAASFFPSSYKRTLARKINARQCDVVIGVHAFMALHLSAVKSRIRTKTVGWLHNSYEAFFEKETPYLPGLDCFFQVQMGKLDERVVLSHADAGCFFRKMNLCCEVIYNPLTVLPKGRGKKEYRRILAVGRFSFGHKGFDILIKAFSVFVKTHPDWTLEIVGEGPEEALYRSLINEYELEKSIALHPFTKEVQEYYAHSSMYVLSSRWEGFGLVMIEAMAHGLPVIASDLPITRELLKDKDMAVLFETGNIAQLAGCVSYMADRTDWEWMGNKAVEYADTFHIEKVCDSWNNLLKKVVYGTR